MDEDGQVVIQGDLHMLLKDSELTLGVLVKTDFANAQDVGALDELGDEAHDFASKARVVGFLGIDAEPAEVLDGPFGGAPRLVFSELAKVVVETFGR